MKTALEVASARAAEPKPAKAAIVPGSPAEIAALENNIRAKADGEIAVLRERRAAIVAIEHPLGVMLQARDQLLGEVERCRVARVYHVEQAADFQAKLDACFRTEAHPQYHQSVFVQNQWQVPSARMVGEIDRFIAAGADKRAECEREIRAYAEKHSLGHLLPDNLK